MYCVAHKSTICMPQNQNRATQMICVALHSLRSGLELDQFKNLLAMHGDFLRGFDADSNLTPLYCQYGDCDFAFTDVQAFRRASRQNQHCGSSYFGRQWPAAPSKDEKIQAGDQVVIASLDHDFQLPYNRWSVKSRTLPFPTGNGQFAVRIGTFSKS